MQINQHTDRDYADALKALLPPGAAYEWPVGGVGDGLMVAAAKELSRIDGAIQQILDRAIELHRPKYGNWHISEYRRVANEALNGIQEILPRKPLRVGSHVGDRCWSHAAPSTTFPVPLLTVDHLLGPCRVGSPVGMALWSAMGRYVLRVRYYRSVVNPKVVFDALLAFKQAHVFLWFEDITGVGGNYGQN